MKTFLLTLAVLLLPFAVAAQEDAKPKPDAAQATTTADPKIAIAELQLRVRPMTAEELAVEAKSWVGVFRKKAQEIADKEVALLAAEGDAKATLLDEANALKAQRTDIQDRLEVVLDSWSAKGGKDEDIKAQRSYLGAASGFVQDWFDVQAVWASVVAWLTSANGGIRLGVNVLLFLVTLLVFRILSRIAGRIVTKIVHRMKGSSDLLRRFSVNFATKFTMFVGFVVALSMLGIDIGPFLAVIGAAGFIIGFALQGTLNNFAAGIMILVYRPFDIGDVITAAGTTGKVDAMTMSSTTVKTPDNQVIIIPNGSIWGGIITNITGSSTRRVDLTFGIGYGDDMAKAEKILKDVVEGHDKVLNEPAPVIQVDELADSSVNFVVRPWSLTGDYWQVRWDLTRQVKERFDAEGISIPFPQRDVHVHQVANGA